MSFQVKNSIFLIKSREKKKNTEQKGKQDNGDLSLKSSKQKARVPWYS